MKRYPGMSDAEWNAALVARKRRAERVMEAADSFYSQEQIRKAAKAWYGRTDGDSQCLAENRLQKGEPHPDPEGNAA